ncbi:MAG: chemotaxis protein CheB [Pseudomonadota bacterium]
MNETILTTDQNTPTHYVGIGASAGGLEAIDAFFTHMPAQSGLAFIVVQHLSPDYKSLMVELLSKKTEMQVHRAEDGMVVTANHVYLIPPKKNLTIFHGKLLLKDQEGSRGINLPIDIFLRSLAEDQTERAVAIILSGTGSDGTRGVRAIKEFGGMVMIQDQESAKFDGMPRAAISTGVADFILTPEDMPDQLLAFVDQPYGSREKRSETLLTDEDGLTRIFAELREKTKVDFTYYKPSTITRRIERRMTVNRMDDLRDYVRYLQTYPGEVLTLYRELLIGVTSFFRDAEAMNEMGEICIPEILQRNRNREIRFWVSGCSTGEEAYTIAILTKEAMEKEKISRDIKIFATDIDRDAIVSAGNGIYPESIAADLTPRLLSKYFYRKEDNYQIARHIREMVVFAQHNLVRDPPFTNIDLISCRNLLIYLQPVLQQKALEMFNFSLNPQGLMFLGSSESIGDMADCFDTVHSKFKIYRSKGKSKSLQKEMAISLQADRIYQGQRLPVRHDRRRNAEPDDSRMIRRYLELVASHYIPLSVIVNEQMEILHIVGNTEGYFSVPSGRAAYDITRMAAKDLAIPLATGIQKVFRSREEIAYTNIRLRHMDATRNIRMRILPMPEKKGNEPLVAVFFEEIRQETPVDLSGEAVYDVGEEARQRIRDLELELQFARENLQATIEELETSNEELQATNEELLASNEELQSTNEELQSTNEELFTVNAEYQNKIIELTELNNDVDNLLTSSRIGTLLLDENLEIRKYSPEITRIFNIMEKDIGRPIGHLSHRFIDFCPVETARQVQQNNRLTEQDVYAEDDRWYLARVMPYHIGPNRFSGVVLTFVDVTELKSARNHLQQSDRLFRDITQYMPVGLYIYARDNTGELVLESSNPKAEQLTGIDAKSWKGRRFDDIWPRAKATGLTDRLHSVLETGDLCYLEDLNYRDDRIQGAYRIQAFRLPGDRLAVIFEDITEEKRMEADLQGSEAKYRTLFETMAQGVVYQSADGQIISANPSAERILGMSLEQMRGRTSMDSSWKAIRENGSPLSGDEHPSMVALKTGKPVSGFVMGVFSQEIEKMRWIMVNATPEFRNGEDKPYQVYATFEDITERI